MSALPPEALIDRHEAFLDRRPVDRPLLGLWFGGYFPAEQYPQGTARWRDGQRLRPKDVRFARFARDYERLYRLHRDVDDDFFFVASAYWGIPWMEAILGCPVTVAGASCTAEPITEAGCRDSDAWLDCVLRFTRDLVAFADGRFPVCAPLLRGPGDCASAVDGAMEFIATCLGDHARASAILRLYRSERADVLVRLADEVPPWHGTYAAGGYPSKVWSRRKVAYCQEDSAALLNPALFRELLLPRHRWIARRSEVSFIHLHSACLWPLDALLAKDIYTVIEVNIDHAGTGPPFASVVPTLQRIQSAGRPLLLWGHFDADDWALVHRELSPVGLSIQPIVESDEDKRVAMKYR